MRVEKLLKHLFKNEGLQVEWHWYRIEYQGRGAPHAHGCFLLKNGPNLIKHAHNVVQGCKAAKMLRDRNLFAHADVIEADYEPEEILFVEWAHAKTKPDESSITLSTFNNVEIDKLQELIRLGKTSQTIIASFHDCFLTTNHPHPSSDASLNERKNNTAFDPSTSLHKHPSGIDPRPILDSPIDFENLYCRSLFC